MVIGIFGESCTGKSTIAQALSRKMSMTVYTGKDYLKLAKNEAEAKKQFLEKLKSNEATGENIIYVITEKDHMSFLPTKAVRVLMIADLETIKERFSKRMNGNMPAAVAAMLEKKHGSFDNEECDLRIDNTDENVSDICEKILCSANEKGIC